MMAGGAKDRIRLYTTEGGWLHLPKQALVDDALEAKSLVLWGLQGQDRAPYPRGRRTTGYAARRARR